MSYRDWLRRYGFELVQKLCEFHDTKIVVHHNPETEGSEQELSEDLLAVCNFFVARNNGRRGGRNTKKGKRCEGKKDQAGSVPGVEGAVEEVDGDGEMDVQPVP